MAEPQRSRAPDLFWPALAAGLLLGYWPLLSQPPVLDDIGLIHWWKVGGMGLGASPGLLQRCLLPHFFRPLAAPIFYLSFSCFGPTAAPLRLLMLAFHMSAAALLFHCGRRLGLRPAASALAACLYGFSAVHWSGMALSAGVAQYACDAFFWAAVLAGMSIEGRRPALLAGLALGTVAVLFKEHAVALVLVAPAARAAARRGRGAVEVSSWAAWAAWALAYVLARLAFRGTFAGSGMYYPLAWPTPSLGGEIRAAIGMLLKSALPFPAAASVAAWSNGLRGAPTAWLWTVLCLVAAAGLGTSVWNLRRIEMRASELGSVFLFALAGLSAGMLPYVPFRHALDLDSAGRLSLSCGALFLGLAALVAAAAKGRAQDAAAAVLCGLLMLKASADFRFPDVSQACFQRVQAFRETAQTERFVEDALAAAKIPPREIVLAGFPDVLRLPWLLEARNPAIRFDSAPAMPAAEDAWLLARETAEAPRTCLTLRDAAGGTFGRRCWD